MQIDLLIACDRSSATDDHRLPGYPNDLACMQGFADQTHSEPGSALDGARDMIRFGVSVCVWSASSLRSIASCEFLRRACPVFALRLRSVHTKRGRRAFCVHYA